MVHGMEIKKFRSCLEFLMKNHAKFTGTLTGKGIFDLSKMRNLDTSLGCTNVLSFISCRSYWYMEWMIHMLEMFFSYMLLE